MPTSNDVVVSHGLPSHIVAIEHDTIDEAMALCEKAHAVVIPNPQLDEAGCRSALAIANPLYERINDLAKALEARRLEEGRKIRAIIGKVDEAVRAAILPLEDQRAKLGAKLGPPGKELARMAEARRVAAEQDRLRKEAEQRAAAQAAERAEAEAKAKAAAAAEAARAAEAAAAQAAAAGEDPLPDDAAIVAAKEAADAAAAAVTVADQAKATALDRTFDATPAPYYAPAPKSVVKTTTHYDVVVEDQALVPDQVGGVPLWTRQLDKAACLTLLKMLDAKGGSIPGLRLVKTETTGAKGRSNAFSVG